MNINDLLKCFIRKPFKPRFSLQNSAHPVYISARRERSFSQVLQPRMYAIVFVLDGVPPTARAFTTLRATSLALRLRSIYVTLRRRNFVQACRLRRRNFQLPDIDDIQRGEGGKAQDNGQKRGTMTGRKEELRERRLRRSIKKQCPNSTYTQCVTIECQKSD